MLCPDADSETALPVMVSQPYHLLMTMLMLMLMLLYPVFLHVYTCSDHASGGAVTDREFASGQSSPSSPGSRVGSSDQSLTDDTAGGVGSKRPLSAGDLLSNEWLVHEIMVSPGDSLQVQYIYYQ